MKFYFVKSICLVSQSQSRIIVRSLYNRGHKNLNF